MGLGPPICPDCEMIMAYHFEHHDPPWECLKCKKVPKDFYGEEFLEVPTNLWSLSTKRQGEYIENTKKYTEETKNENYT